MESPTDSNLALPGRPRETELADGSRLVLVGEARPARLDGRSDHAFTLADAQRENAGPFAGYRLERA